MSVLIAQVRRLREWESYMRGMDGPWAELHEGHATMIADELRDAADTIEELRGKLQGNDSGEVTQ